MTYMRTGLSLTAALTLSVSTLSPALAQEGTGLRGTLTFSQGIELSDNPDLETVSPGTTLTSRTGLGFALGSETRTQLFRFSLGTELEGDFRTSGGSDFEISNTNAELEYRRDGANAQLSFSARYSEVQLDDEVAEVGGGLFGFGGTGVVVIDTGSRTSTSFGAAYEMGLEGPFGLRVSSQYSKLDYQDTLDPDLDDSENVRLDALARFRLNPTLAVRGLAGISRTRDEDATNTETTDTYVGVGIENETAGGLSYSGDLFFDRSKTTVTGPSTTTEDGLGIEVSVTQDLLRGSRGVTLASRIDDSGRRTQAAYNQSIDLPTGEFSFSLGVVDQEDDDQLRLSGSLNYMRETPRGGLTASLSQTPGTRNGTAYLSTRLSLSYEEAINDRSGWGAGITYSAANELAGGDDDSRASASLAYTHELTEDWQMRTGISHTRLNEAGVADRSSNTVFFNIERDFTFGF
jgi:hypothetical protein